MKLKKLLTFMLVGTMTFGTVLPAYAAETETETIAETETVAETETETETTAETEIVEITEGESLPTEPNSLGEAAGSQTLSNIPEKDIDITSLMPNSTTLNNILSNLPQTYSTNEEIFALQIQELYLVNKIRAAYGIDLLALGGPLSEAAMIRAEECSRYFSHTRPNGTDCFTIAHEMNIPYNIIGENIAQGYYSPEHVVEAWYNSDGHRANMLNQSFDVIGLGYHPASRSWVQLFTGDYEIADFEVFGLDNYNVGQTLEEQGLVLSIQYTNGFTGIVPVINEMVTGFDPNKEGKQTVSIYCQGYDITVTLSVRDNVKAFVSRLYTQILGREADPSGLNSWTNVLKNKQEQGAKVAQGFIESPEFKKRNLSDKEYISILYKTFLDREADGAGLAAWQKVLDDGLSRLHVFKGFAESQEFTDICASYNIERGNAILTAPMDQNEGVTKFIARCYKLCLGRKGDESGINSWCNQILTGKNTAKQAAHGFVFSDEFKKKNLSNENYVKTMYRVFMDREADPAGLSSWVKVLNSGKSREHVFNGFADSNEFRKICNSYGIK